MKLSELISAAGDENVMFQNLLQDATGVRRRPKERDALITFATSPDVMNDFIAGSDAVKALHLVVHIPVDKLPQTLQALVRRGSQRNLETLEEEER